MLYDQLGDVWDSTGFARPYRRTPIFELVTGGVTTVLRLAIYCSAALSPLYVLMMYVCSIVNARTAYTLAVTPKRLLDPQSVSHGRSSIRVTSVDFGGGRWVFSTTRRRVVCLFFFSFFLSPLRHTTVAAQSCQTANSLRRRTLSR